MSLDTARRNAHREARVVAELHRLMAAGVRHPAIAARCALALEQQRRRAGGRPPTRIDSTTRREHGASLAAPSPLSYVPPTAHRTDHEHRSRTP